MEPYLSSIPFHIVPLAISVISIVIMLRHRHNIGVRRVTFGIVGITLLISNRVGMSMISIYLTSHVDRDFQRIATRQSLIGLVSSVIEAAALWLVFIAITNRRSAKNV